MCHSKKIVHFFPENLPEDVKDCLQKLKTHSAHTESMLSALEDKVRVAQELLKQKAGLEKSPYYMDPNTIISLQLESDEKISDANANQLKINLLKRDPKYLDQNQMQHLQVLINSAKHQLGDRILSEEPLEEVVMDNPEIMTQQDSNPSADENSTPEADVAQDNKAEKEVETIEAALNDLQLYDTEGQENIDDESSVLDLIDSRIGSESDDDFVRIPSSASSVAQQDDVSDSIFDALLC